MVSQLRRLGRAEALLVGVYEDKPVQDGLASWSFLGAPELMLLGFLRGILTRFSGIWANNEILMR